MTGGQILPLVAILAAIVAINLAVTWLLVRWDRDPAALLGTARYAPENATDRSGSGGAERERPADGESDRSADEKGAGSGRGPRAPAGDDPTETTVLRTSAGTELTLSGSDAGDEAPPPLDADGETVVCRHCGAENRPGYRYCRWCVRSGFVDDDTGGGAGPTMTERSL